MNYVVKSVMASLTIAIMITFGIALYLASYIFWGMLNLIAGYIVIYFLCIEHFKNEEAGK